jgi:hypothetical protein
MSTDLYSADLKTISGSDLYQAISEFSRLDRPRDDRPREGYLLDFKENVSDRFLHSVASLANTFGGLLILGVSEVDGRPENFVGVTVANELKTQVSSFIASNLFPCPHFEIAECSLPADAGKKLCVVRVRETAEICMVAKKGEPHPIYVRVEDQSIPPDASKLRALIDRKRDTLSNNSTIERAADSLRESLLVTCVGPHGPRTRSNTFFRVILFPHAHILTPLDLDVERKFFGLVSEQNPGLQALVNVNDATVEFRRERDWSEVTFLDSPLDYERRWRVGVTGEIAFITQTRWPLKDFGDLWSLSDVARDISSAAKLAKAFWQYTEHYGRFRLDAELSVESLRLAFDNKGFAPLFYQRLGHNVFPLDRTSVVVVDAPGVTSRAQADLAYDALDASLPDTIAATVNQLLRGLGHVGDLQKLKQAFGG